MKIKYVGLLFECPLGLKSDMCVFNDLRAMPIQEALDLWYEMNSKPQIEMLEKHKKCFCNSEYEICLNGRVRKFGAVN